MASAYSEPDPSWKHFSAAADGLVTTSQCCPDRPYVSLPLPVSADRYSVCRVVLTTVSHDQGFSSHDGNSSDPYDASHTFFDVRVATPTGSDRVSRFSFQQNVRASFEYKTHVNSWDRRDGGDSVQWLGAVRPGDAVQIVPKAIFLAWTNFVREARIDVWTAAGDGSRPPEGSPRAAALHYEPQSYSMHRTLRHERGEIRLLEISPGDGSTPLRLALRYTSLQDSEHVAYDCLSYTWGDAWDPASATLSDPEVSRQEKTVSIGKNLFAALARLRRPDTPVVLWVDILCISQIDLDERARQVALMGEIYASADTVYVWLGEGRPDVLADFDVIRSISERYGAARSDNSLKPTHETHQVIADGGGFYLMDNDRLFRLPWFERVWVLQEVWSRPQGKRKRVLVCCGHDQLPWEAVARANFCLSRQHVVHNNAKMPWAWSALFDVGRGTLDCVPAPRLDILTVAVAAHNMKATDPRDRLFALYAFGDETHRIAELPARVRPDYSKTVEQVYADFTRWWILHHRSLTILSAVHTLAGRTWLDVETPSGRSRSGGTKTKTEPGRPSWSFWFEGRSEWMRGTLALGSACSYEAAGPSSVVDLGLLESVWETASPDILALRGVAVGTVAVKSSVPTRPDPPPSPAMLEAFLRVVDPECLIGTWLNTKIRSSPRDRVDVVDHTTDLSGLWTHYGTHWGSRPPQLPAEYGDVGRLAFSFPCHGDCFFSTAEGDVGLCPAGTQVGDLVVVLHGARVPYILRPVPGDSSRSHRLVGECYVEGAMHGEVLSKSPEVFYLV